MKDSDQTHVNDNHLVRYVAFWVTWFLAVPLVGALLAVWVIAMPGSAPGQGIFGAIRAFGREQPVPAGIIAFTLLEMLLWSRRHSLPGAGAVGVGGRTDVPPDLRRRYEEADHLLDEADRILLRKGRDVERQIPASDRDELHQALDSLREQMTRVPFDPDGFERAFGRAGLLVDRHLATWHKSEIREYAESIGIAVAVALILRTFVIEAFKIPSPSMVPTLQVGDHIFVNKSAYGPMVPWINKRLFAHMPPRYGDVMVFQFPENPEQDFIKRVIALPGDKLEALDGRPIINGWRPPECKVGTYRYSWTDTAARPGWEEPQHEGDLYVEYLGDEAFLTFYDRAMTGPGYDARRSCNSDADCEPGLACRAHLCGDLQGPYQVKAGEVWVMGDNRNNSHDSRGWWGGQGGGVPFDNIKGRALVIWMSFKPDAKMPWDQAWDRIGISVMGRPKMPPVDASLQPAVDRCFDHRPSLSESTPPPSAGGR